MGRYFQLKIYVTYRPTSLCCCILRDTWKRDQTVQKLEFLKSWQKTTIWNALYSGGYFCLLLNVNSEFGRFFFSLIFYRLQGINFSDTFFNIIKYLKIVRKCCFFLLVLHDFPRPCVRFACTICKNGRKWDRGACLKDHPVYGTSLSPKSPL